MLWKWDLRTKLTVGVVGVLLPLLLLQLHEFRQERARRLDAVAVDLQQSAQLASQVVARKLQSGLELARTLGLASDVRSPDADAAHRFLERVAEGRDEVAHVAIFDREGERIAHSLAGIDVGSQLDPQSRARVLERGETLLSHVVIDARNSRPTVVAAAPIEDEAGKTIGFVEVALRLDLMAQRLRRVELAPGQAVLITDTTGTLAMHTDAPQMPWQTYDVSGVPVIREAFRSGATYSDSYVSAITHDRRVVAVVPVQTLGWLVAVSWSIEAAFGPIERSHQKSLLLFFVIATASIVGAAALAKLFSAPISSLASQAHALGQGQLDRRSEVRTGDELEALGRAFDAMAERLEDEKQRRGMFISAIAHEMRNMLAPLHLASQSVLRRLRSQQAPAERSIDTILNQADRLAGLDADQLETVFAPYKRLHRATGVPGLGLGLFICRAIVEQHGGRLWAQSDGRAKGSMFVFTLPRTLRIAGALAAHSSAKSPPDQRCDA